MKQPVSAAAHGTELIGARGVTQLDAIREPSNGWQDRARRAFCDPYLAVARDEIEHLKAIVANSAGQKQKATEECEKVSPPEQTLASEWEKYAPLERELVEAQREIHRLSEQLRISLQTTISAEARAADEATALAQEREKVVALSREIARLEVEQLKQKTKPATEQGNARERARAAALDRDLRATQRKLQRLREERESGKASFFPFPFRM
jgi:hypothetical protein